MSMIDSEHAAERCVFCQWEGKLSREHVWPKWIRSVVPEGTRQGSIRRARVSAKTGEAHTHLRHGLAASRRIRVICRSRCNGGWMSDLEQQIRPILEPLILGDRSRPLSSADQALLGLWSLKTAMMLEYLHPPDIRAIPPSHYEYLYQRRQPPSNSRIWLVPYAGEPLRTAHVTRGHLLPGPEPGEGLPFNAYTTVLAIGQIVMHMVGGAAIQNFSVRPQDRWTELRRSTWPSAPESINLSKSALSTFAEFEDFASAMVAPTH